ncbi:MAG: hypothetical protein NC331_08350 [Lachnospiraceae bacterium]|nr:hypothetical protein [Lachnospiraceae bacterium]MCM1239382.1 hypothetical protein [Lachnospiraceae bacterium]
MKNKALTVILAFALICLAGLSIFLFWNLRKAKEQAAVFSENVISADEELDSLKEQLEALESLQEQAAGLSRELEESAAKVKDLEDTISEGNAQIAKLQSTIDENAATIAELEQQLNEAQRSQTNSSGNSNPSSNNSSTPINTMPGGANFNPDSSGIGTGAAPGTLGVGTFE